MVAKKKVKKASTVVIEKYPRELPDDQYVVRDLHWAVGIICVCGRELDLFVRNIDVERKCPTCGRSYDLKLVAYEVKR